MELCECGEAGRGEHHPSIHFAERRDALMVRIDRFMDEVYPDYIFGQSFDRKQVSLIAACFILGERKEG